MHRSGKASDSLIFENTLSKEVKCLEAGVLDTLGTAVAFVLGKFTAMATQMLSTPLFLLPLGIFVLGACIGLVKRLIH